MEEHSENLKALHSEIDDVISDISKEGNVATSRLGEICEALKKHLEKVEPSLGNKSQASQTMR